tara:strand:+ start:938 stop:1267 length:330 start_codon:yes stop_codon:yes gene_type:complete
MTNDNIIHEDQRALGLTHYQMAERCMLVEYATIREEMDEDGSSQTLIHILEGGFEGFHDMPDEGLIKEYKDIEDKFYRLYEDGGLPYELYDEDPLIALEEDETGEVANG